MSTDAKSQDSRELHAVCDKLTVGLGKFADELWNLNRVLAEDLGLPLSCFVRDKKKQPSIAAGSKEFIDDIPDPRLRLVYSRQMRAPTAGRIGEPDMAPPPTSAGGISSLWRQGDGRRQKHYRHPE